MGADRTRYVVEAERSAVSYGPSRQTPDQQGVLALATGDERPSAAVRIASIEYRNWAYW